eukprot:scaffold91509_cov20-Attheya_sp.AAC.1
MIPVGATGNSERSPHRNMGELGVGGRRSGCHGGVGCLCDRRVLGVVKTIVDATRTQCEKVSYSSCAARSKIPSSDNRARGWSTHPLTF